MGLLAGWEVEDVDGFVGTCSSGCRIDDRRPWPVTVVVAMVRPYLPDCNTCQLNPSVLRDSTLLRLRGRAARKSRNQTLYSVPPGGVGDNSPAIAS